MILTGYHIKRALGISYTNHRNDLVELTDAEIKFFAATVERVLKATDLNIAVYTADHEKLPGKNSDALGIHWRREDSDDEFITIDNYFLHEAYEVAHERGNDLNGETLASVLCHELAHIHYQRHTKYHAALTDQYLGMVNRAAS